MIAEKITFEDNLTLQDRVRIYLNTIGQREISITVEQLAADLGKPEASVYQVINNLRKASELDVIKAQSDNGGPDKIVGLVINKLEPSGRTYRKVVERSGRITRITPAIMDNLPNVELSLDNLMGYLQKKLAVEDMKTRALAAGLDESVISFEPDQMAEEGVQLLKLFTDLRIAFEDIKEKYQMQEFDLEAERRNVNSLQQRLRENTDQMLREYNES